MNLFHIRKPNALGNRSNLSWMIICYLCSVVFTFQFWRVSALQNASPFNDSIMMMLIDVIPFGLLSIITLICGYFFSEKIFNPDKHIFEPHTSQWQKLFLESGDRHSRHQLIISFMSLSQRRSLHFNWFDILFYTNKFCYITDDEARFRRVYAEYEKRENIIIRKPMCKRIAKTLRYSELEAWLPHYILLAADKGDPLAKQLSKYLPIKTRFFWKKNTLSVSI